MTTEFKIAVTYGGFMGRLVRRLGGRWNHVILVQFYNDLPTWVYQSNFSGVTGAQFNVREHLAWEHAWYAPVKPLTEADKGRLVGFCQGAIGKWYALHLWPGLFWRVLKRLFVTHPLRMLIAPTETCVTFVDAACDSIERPVTQFGLRGLPDDVTDSPHWKEVE